MLEQEIERKITKDSISLEGYGLNNLAWKKEGAKRLICAIMEDKIGILGGDVYRLAADHLEALYDNWACEPAEIETEEEYYLRSKKESLQYIENYPLDENIIFSITFTIKLK